MVASAGLLRKGNQSSDPAFSVLCESYPDNILMAMKKENHIIKTRFGSHVCVFEKDTKGYVVVAKDIKGVVTWGKNLTHAKAMAKEALELMIETTAIESPLSVAVKNNKYQVA